MTDSICFTNEQERVFDQKIFLSPLRRGEVLALLKIGLEADEDADNASGLDPRTDPQASRPVLLGDQDARLGLPPSDPVPSRDGMQNDELRKVPTSTCISRTDTQWRRP